MSSCLRHTAHPLQLCTIQVVSPGYLSTTIVDTFLALLKIIAIVTTISIYGLIIKLYNYRTNAIKEETIVSNHQQGLVATIKESLQPLNHLKIQVVGRLIKDKQIRISYKYICQSNTFLLTTTKLAHRLL